MAKTSIPILLVILLAVSGLVSFFLLSPNQPITGKIVSETKSGSEEIQSDFSGYKYVSKIIDGDTVIIE